MMRVLAVLFCALFLTNCSFSGGGFKPPGTYYVWHLHERNNHKLPKILLPINGDNTDSVYNYGHEYLTLRENDMRACGMDPVIGESTSPKANLCLERKGWYLEGGPVCENRIMWDRPLCIEWRAKHSKPDAKPWE